MLDFRSNYDKKDNRKQKVYAAVADHYVGMVIHPETSLTDPVVSPHYHELMHRLDERVSKLFPLYDVTSDGFERGHRGWGDGWVVDIRVRIVQKVTKPSLIPSEEDFAAETQKIVSDVMAEEAGKWLLEVIDSVHQNLVLSQVNQLGSFFARACRKEAEKIVRYHQRLEALRAELVAEIRVQAEQEIDDINVDSSWEKEAVEILAYVYQSYLPTKITGGPLCGKGLDTGIASAEDLKLLR